MSNFAARRSWRQTVTGGPPMHMAHLFSELPQRDIEADDAIDDLPPWNLALPDPSH